MNRLVLRRLLNMILYLIILAALCYGCFIISAKVNGENKSDSLPGVFWADPLALAAAKARYSDGNAIKDHFLDAPLEQLMLNASLALKIVPPAVTDKRRMAPSSDPHDYVSYARYYWHDNNTGKYVSRDGLPNPEADVDSDEVHFFTVCQSVSTLALAYYVSGNETFGKHAVVFLKRFFLDPSTKMNPNLNYGQGIPGQVDGRYEGLIGTRFIVQLVDALGMMDDGNTFWTMVDRHAMKTWMTDYFTWLTTSDIGKAASTSQNNHGTYYDAQLVSIALYLGRTSVARKVIKNAGVIRLSQQIFPNGWQPWELSRSTSLHYTLFNLKGFSDLASLGRSIGVDLWNYKAINGKMGLLQIALEFMAPYADFNVTWPFKQIASIPLVEFVDVLLQAGSHYPESRPIINVLKKLNSDGHVAFSPMHLLFKTFPLYTEYTREKNTIENGYLYLPSVTN